MHTTKIQPLVAATFAGLMGVAALMSAAHAAYPEREIELVVPYSAGGR